MQIAVVQGSSLASFDVNIDPPQFNYSGYVFTSDDNDCRVPAHIVDQLGVNYFFHFQLASNTNKKLSKMSSPVQGKRRMDTDVIKLIESKHEVKTKLVALNPLIFLKPTFRSQFLAALMSSASNFTAL